MNRNCDRNKIKTIQLQVRSIKSIEVLLIVKKQENKGNEIRITFQIRFKENIGRMCLLLFQEIIISNSQHTADIIFKIIIIIESWISWKLINIIKAFIKMLKLPILRLWPPDWIHQNKEKRNKCLCFKRTKWWAQMTYKLAGLWSRERQCFKEMNHKK